MERGACGSERARWKSIGARDVVAAVVVVDVVVVAAVHVDVVAAVATTTTTTTTIVLVVAAALLLSLLLCFSVIRVRASLLPHSKRVCVAVCVALG